VYLHMLEDKSVSETAEEARMRFRMRFIN